MHSNIMLCLFTRKFRHHAKYTSRSFAVLLNSVFSDKPQGYLLLNKKIWQIHLICLLLKMIS